MFIRFCLLYSLHLNPPRLPPAHHLPSMAGVGRGLSPRGTVGRTGPHQPKGRGGRNPSDLLVRPMALGQGAGDILIINKRSTLFCTDVGRPKEPECFEDRSLTGKYLKQKYLNSFSWMGCESGLRCFVFQFVILRN